MSNSEDSIFASTPVAEKILKPVSSDSIVADLSACFVIGNFQTCEDRFYQSFNKSSGVEQDTFLYVFKEYAKQHGLSVEYELDDTIVLMGKTSKFEALKSQHGSSFAYAITDREGVEAMLHAEELYQKSQESEYAQKPEPLIS